MKKYDKDKIKNALTIEQVFNLISDLGGNPLMNNGFFTSETICHNHPGEGSHKLYYYDNTKLFRCYTECDGTFDIFELICKVKNIAQEYKIGYNENGEEITRGWALYDAVQFVAEYYGFEAENENFYKNHTKLHDWEILNKYEENQFEKQRQIIDLHIYDDKILKYLPRPRIKEWEAEGISAESMAAANICYDPISNGIIIPHYDINNNLIGIRTRTLIKEKEQYGKYKPIILKGTLYNHPLGFNLYNLNNSKNNIRNFQKVFIFEGEKSCLKYRSFFGKENDISVAVCGNTLSSYQVSLLISLGCKEIIMALDKQYKEIQDFEWAKWIKKFMNFFNNFEKYIQFSFLIDKENLLDYKDSPIDKGKIVFLQLYNNRLKIK